MTTTSDKKLRNQPVIIQALNTYWPEAQWRFSSDGFSEMEFDYDHLDWLSEDMDKPSEDEVLVKIGIIQSELNANQYQFDRQQAYPKIEEQLDMLWHAIDSGTLDQTSDFYTTLKTVKDNSPKPSE